MDSTEKVVGKLVVADLAVLVHVQGFVDRINLTLRWVLAYENSYSQYPTWLTFIIKLRLNIEVTTNL